MNALGGWKTEVLRDRFPRSGNISSFASLRISAAGSRFAHAR